ncbi:hypothetical protein [Falsiroseomonas sp.]|uniref:hypothetical protein n=1 Tax=Falsiroseomonas sp. TaxID=2870721 RepID=UPI002735CC3A|nr:hypothetical protein [Falsiroseomonas sp.]MDP3415207.1 hypothetical protein [Falsiroseomonas sp.]
MTEGEARADVAARWLVEALESGNPLARFPPELAPRDALEGAETAAAMLDQTGHVACGVRILRRPAEPSLTGPVIEGRLLPMAATVALAALRHPSASAALLGVLGAPLEADGIGMPSLLRLHPAIDLAATRFSEVPSDVPSCIADLALLGYLVVGKPRPWPSAPVRVALTAPANRPRGELIDLEAAFMEAAAAARALGGLPAGAVLVVAGLTPTQWPEPGVALAARFSSLGKAEAQFV